MFGANELPGKLFTTDHELVVIDSEQMFSARLVTHARQVMAQK
jgi:hypothetical protein